MNNNRFEALVRQQVQARKDRAAARRRPGRPDRLGRVRPEDDPRWRRIAD